MADNAAKEEIQNEKVGRKEPSLQAQDSGAAWVWVLGKRIQG